jgi:periplasmic divalent cation tolerance protein
MQAIEVHVSVPDQETADLLAKHLLEQKLAACVQDMGTMRSQYLWKGNLESASEHLLLIKSISDLYSSLEKCILEFHPYDIPEIIALPVQNISSRYLEWMKDELQS